MTFIPLSDGAGTTDRGLREALTGSVAFEDKTILERIFKPSLVDDSLVSTLVNDIKNAKFKQAWKKVLNPQIPGPGRYDSMMTILEHISTLDFRPESVEQGDYAGHIHRRWKNVGRKPVVADPAVYLPTKEEESDDDMESETDEDEDEGEGEDEDEDDDEGEGELEGEGEGEERDKAENEGEEGSTQFSEVPNGQEYLPIVGQKRARHNTPTDSGRYSKASKTATGKKAQRPTVIDPRNINVGNFDVNEEGDLLDRPLGRHGCLWVAMKVSKEKKPNPDPTDPKKVKQIVRQIADTARLHMATRPFLRYSLHITICGNIFNVCVLDRSGGAISEDFHLKKATGLETFIRVIRRVSCEMDAYDLGLDPTVVPISHLGSFGAYPRFKVPVGESVYYTQGLPLWQSTTLQGRGTWVFNVSKSQEQASDQLILKTAWRAPTRFPESTVYELVQKIKTTPNMRDLACVAEFIEGGDVMISDTANTTDGSHPTPLQVSIHRNVSSDSDLVSHRLVLGTRGRSLVSYTSISELINAAKCVVDGLEALHDRGILHRDVSIGNVFIGTDPAKPAGFVSDFDLCSVSRETIKELFPDQHEALTAQLAAGEFRTGTALFMSTNLLQELARQRLFREEEIDFIPDLGEDLESLIWVVVYAMMIHHRNNMVATRDAARLGDYKEILNSCWGAYSHRSLGVSHNSMVMRGFRKGREVDSVWFQGSDEVSLFRALMRFIIHLNDGEVTEVITPRSLHDVFDKELKRIGENLTTD